MDSGIITTLQVTGATVVSTGVAMSVNAEPLLTALITLGVSLVTVVGAEAVKFLVAFIKKKRQDIEDKIHK